MEHNSGGALAKQNHPFIMIDGLDGVGKGVVLDALVTGLRARGLRIFDLHEFWNHYQCHPEFDPEFSHDSAYVDLASFDVLVSSEPTFVGIGHTIRFEMIGKRGRAYSARATAEAYGLDRLVFYKRVILPCRAAGKVIVQSRGVSTSIVYQPLQGTVQGEPFSLQDVLKLPGNALALEHAPDLLLIPTIADVAALQERLASREKDDDCAFENLDFQLKLKPLYESIDLRTLFEQHGSAVRFIDASVSVDETKKQSLAVCSALFPGLF